MKSLDWIDDAACEGMNDVRFFPDIGSSGVAGKVICAGCAVRERCRDYAIENRIRHGIFGGMTVRERERFRRQRNSS